MTGVEALTVSMAAGLTVLVFWLIQVNDELDGLSDRIARLERDRDNKGNPYKGGCP